jgi:hypothetical protein
MSLHTISVIRFLRRHIAKQITNILKITFISLDMAGMAAVAFVAFW